MTCPRKEAAVGWLNRRRASGRLRYQTYPQTFTTTMSSISEEANKLADFILFTQRSCILNLSSELNEGKVSYPQFSC